MANSLSWKEKARIECKEKGFESLENSQKREIYISAFDKLREINIDKKSAEELLRVLRGE